MWKEYAEPEFRELLDIPGGGWVQGHGIQRAYPEMPPEFLDGGGGGDDDWEMNAAGDAPTGTRTPSTR